MDIFQEELQIIFKYFSDINSHQKWQIEQLRDLYTYWNERINLISRKDIKHLYLHHVLHSLSIAKIVQFLSDASVLDIGTGGGFPGIPLAILFPDTHFYLNDSIQKKIHVLNEIKKTLQLKNVTIVHDRAEKIKTKHDFIIGRSVTNFSNFLILSQNKIKKIHKHSLPNGILYLKGGDMQALQNEMGKYYNNTLIFDLYNYFPYPFFEAKRLIHYAIIK